MSNAQLLHEVIISLHGFGCNSQRLQVEDASERELPKALRAASESILGSSIADHEQFTSMQRDMAHATMELARSLEAHAECSGYLVENAQRVNNVFADWSVGSY